MWREHRGYGVGSQDQRTAGGWQQLGSARRQLQGGPLLVSTVSWDAHVILGAHVMLGKEVLHSWDAHVILGAHVMLGKEVLDRFLIMSCYVPQTL